MGGLSINGTQQSSSSSSIPSQQGGGATVSSQQDQFSPPRHHYPIVGSPELNGFAAAHHHQQRKASINETALSPSDSSLGKSPRERARSMSTNTQQPKVLTPFVPKTVFLPEEDHDDAGSSSSKITPKVLLLENVNEAAVAMFRAQGYEVETEKGALGEDELIQRLVKGGYSALGIRSKTKVTAKVIDSVKNVSEEGNLTVHVVILLIHGITPAHRHRLLLHWNKSSRSHRSITCWIGSIQFSFLKVSERFSPSFTVRRSIYSLSVLLQLPIRGRTRHLGNRCPLKTTMRPLLRTTPRNLE